MDPEYLKARIPRSRGDTYHPGLLEKARVALIDTNLFATVGLRAGPELDRDGLLPVAVQLVERQHRTVKLSSSYGTDTGPGVRGTYSGAGLPFRGWWLATVITTPCASLRS